jgi:caffeoyl-CoA O-methyltransferase
VTVVSRPGAPRPVTPQAILASRLEQLADRLDAASSIERALQDELRDLCALAGGLDPYLSQLTTPESADLTRLARRTEAEDWNRHAGGYLEQEMLSGHVEGQTLKMLVHATRATRVLEIGMFTGYSALAMAEALPGHRVRDRPRGRRLRRAALPRVRQRPQDHGQGRARPAHPR